MAKVLIFLGIILVLVGVVWLVFPNIFSWIGRLPGDIRYESGNTRIYFPVMTMIIISVVGSILLNLFNR
ncbi:DUF2905 domain-containing protein [Psychrobacter sp. I-STPA6b]|uniref:DUF2905 domain-containing protein n=1 Tax=Psychrobacter sp. I-STPA6b TaxID=2585718 RepID=UPI001D0C12F8|nr:DUF2905 domain-containing protein [Psychrobacter sp. I-STPA6b]